MTIETMTPQETAEYLRSCGMKITAETIRDALEHKCYDWGTYIPKKSGSCVCFVYKKLLLDWIKSLSMEE